MVKVLAIEGNRIKLSRKALIKEQKAKLQQAAPAEMEEAEEVAVETYVAPVKTGNEFDERQPKSNQSTILIEGGDDFEDEDGEEFDEENEPNFNRVDGAPVQPAQGSGATPGAGRPAAANSNRRRRRRRPGGGSGGGRGPGAGGQS